MASRALAKTGERAVVAACACDGRCPWACPQCPCPRPRPSMPPSMPPALDGLHEADRHIRRRPSAAVLCCAESDREQRMRQPLRGTAATGKAEDRAQLPQGPLDRVRQLQRRLYLAEGTPARDELKASTRAAACCCCCWLLRPLAAGSPGLAAALLDELAVPRAGVRAPGRLCTALRRTRFVHIGCWPLRAYCNNFHVASVTKRPRPAPDGAKADRRPHRARCERPAVERRQRAAT